MEGLEIPILESIPFDKLDISVISAEYRHGNGGAPAYKDLMKSKGYKVYKDIDFSKPEIYLGVKDLVFVKDGTLWFLEPKFCVANVKIVVTCVDVVKACV